MRLGLIGLALGTALLGGLIYSLGPANIARGVMQAGWALPGATAIHMGQLALSALAWGVALDGVSFLTVYRVRWIREAVNSLLPVAQIGGPVVGARLLVQAGVTPARAGAATTLDLMTEAAGQIVFTLAAVAVVASVSNDRSWTGWTAGGLVATVAGLAALVGIQRAGGLRLVEVMTEWLMRRWPALPLAGLRGLHADLMQLQARPSVIARGVAWHTLSWAMGAAEVWVILHAIGQPMSIGACFVIESFGMMARSAAFAVPGAVGVQEGGFVLAAGLFGIPAETAVALSVLKRIRELIVGGVGIAVWLRPKRRGKSGPATSLQVAEAAQPKPPMIIDRKQ